MDTKSPKLIATYYRVSTSTQEDNQTIQTQVSTLKDFAEKNQLKIVQEYKDEGVSGTSADKRDEFQRMRTDARRGLFDVLVVHKYDRLARNRAGARTCRPIKLTQHIRDKRQHLSKFR